MPAGALKTALENWRQENENWDEDIDLLSLAHDFNVTLPQMAQRLVRLHPWALVSFLGAGQEISRHGLHLYPEWQAVLTCPDWAIHRPITLPQGAP